MFVRLWEWWRWRRPDVETGFLPCEWADQDFVKRNMDSRFNEGVRYEMRHWRRLGDDIVWVQAKLVRD